MKKLEVQDNEDPFLYELILLSDLVFCMDWYFKSSIQKDQSCDYDEGIAFLLAI